MQRVIVDMHKKVEFVKKNQSVFDYRFYEGIRLRNEISCLRSSFVSDKIKSTCKMKRVR